MCVCRRKVSVVWSVEGAAYKVGVRLSPSWPGNLNFWSVLHHLITGDCDSFCLECLHKQRSLCWARWDFSESGIQYVLDGKGLCAELSQFARAPLVKFRRRGDLTEIYFLTVLEAGNSRSKCWWAGFFWGFSPWRVGGRLLPCPHVVLLLCFHVLIFSSCKDTSHTGEWPIPVTSFNMDYCFKDLLSK